MRSFFAFIKILLRCILKPLSFVPALLIMYMIFSFSSQDGTTSSHLSLHIAKEFVSLADETLDLALTDAQIDHYAERIHYYIRKTAHVTEYFILAISVSFPLYVYGIRGLYLVFFSGIFCVGFAGLDEYHQSFVSGRSPSVRDVCIDSMGIFPGIYIVRLIGFIGRKTLFKPLSYRKDEI